MTQAEAGVATVWRLELARLPDPSGLIALLDTQDKQRAERYTHAEGRHRFIVCRAALRLLLGERLGRDPRQLRLEYDAHGKPHLSDHPDGVSFNLSHSGGMALIALADGPPIGVDVEAWRPARANLAIAHRCFAPTELARWRALPEALRGKKFFTLWTRKEAFAKAVGQGITIGLERIAFDTSGSLAAVPPGCGQPQDWLVQDLELGDGYSGALAMANPDGKIHINDFAFADWT